MLKPENKSREQQREETKALLELYFIWKHGGEKALEKRLIQKEIEYKKKEK